MSLTDDIRVKADAAAVLLADIKALADDIDALPSGPPSGNEPPQAVDCLAGTAPTWGIGNQNPGEATEANWIQQRGVYQRKMLNAPDGTIMFLGDSHIEAMSLAGVTYADNYGISGESFRQLLYRLNEGGTNNLIHRAGAVVILTGVNDLGDPNNGNHANRAATVNIMFDKLEPWLTGKVVIVKIPPVDASVFSDPSNSAIATVNAYIDTKFGSRANTVVVDANATLAPSGSLLSQYHLDGQHLNAAGYAVLRPLIVQALVSLGVL